MLDKGIVNLSRGVLCPGDELEQEVTQVVNSGRHELQSHAADC